VKPYDLVVFDWDGTVVDSIAAISDAIIGAAVDLGLPEPPRERASWVLGLGLLDAIRHAVPTLAREQIPDFVARYRVHYLRRETELPLFGGIREMLRGLDAAGVPLAVATGKSRAGLDRALRATELRRHFVTTRCADEGAPKPDPWMLTDIGDELQIPADRIVMIGDTVHDVGMARAAGSRSIAVLYGAHDRDTLRASHPDDSVESVAELADRLAAALGIERSLLGPGSGAGGRGGPSGPHG
jgi:phosphoglycolate phosphatase